MSRSGKVFTFYSFKGGTGRSMAVANVAWILASRGKRVMVIDWDIEAPGVHRYFRPFLLDPELESTPGLMEFFSTYADAALTPGEDKPSDWYLDYVNLKRYATSVRWNFREPGKIDFVPAGRQGAAYGELVNSFSWKHFYEELGGGGFLQEVRKSLTHGDAAYDFVLIDSRTGVSDTSGICTVALPDTLVICIVPNNQSILGAANVARSVRNQTKERPIRILPVIMRADRHERDRLDARLAFCRRQFSEFIPEQDPYWLEMQVPYEAYFAYEEVLATFRDQPGDPRSVLWPHEKLTALITDGEVKSLEPPLVEKRREVLASYAEVGDQHGVLSVRRTPFGTFPILAFMVLLSVSLAASWYWTRSISMVTWAEAVIGPLPPSDFLYYSSTAFGGLDRFGQALVLDEFAETPGFPSGMMTARHLIGDGFASMIFSFAPMPTASPAALSAVAQSIGFTTDGSLVFAMVSGQALFWTTDNAEFKGSVGGSPGSTSAIDALAFHPRGSRIVVRTGNEIALWEGSGIPDLSRWKRVEGATLKPPNTDGNQTDNYFFSVGNLKFSPDGETLFVEGDLQFYSRLLFMLNASTLQVKGLIEARTLLTSVNGMLIAQYQPSNTTDLRVGMADRKITDWWTSSGDGLQPLAVGEGRQEQRTPETGRGSAEKSPVPAELVLLEDLNITEKKDQAVTEKRETPAGVRNAVTIRELAQWEKKTIVCAVPNAVPIVTFSPKGDSLMLLEAQTGAVEIITRDRWIRYAASTLPLRTCFDRTDESGRFSGVWPVETFRLGTTYVAPVYHPDGRRFASVSLSLISEGGGLPVLDMWRLGMTRPGAAASWSEMLDYFRIFTQARCLPSEDRQRVLGETAEVAQAGAEACRRKRN